jgi:hypothetical protein
MLSAHAGIHVALPSSTSNLQKLAEVTGTSEPVVDLYPFRDWGHFGLDCLLTGSKLDTVSPDCEACGEETQTILGPLCSKGRFLWMGFGSRRA